MRKGPQLRRKKIKKYPLFLPKGYRFLETGEFVHQDDWYWSPIEKCYFPISRKPGWVGERVIGLLTFIRRI